MKRGLALVLIASWFFQVAPTHAQEITSIELRPVQDATVKLSDPYTSFGSSNTLDVLYVSGTDPTRAPQEVHESYLQFDLSPLPKNVYITLAQLQIKGVGSSAYGYSDMRIRRVTSRWNEDVTWATRPAYSDQSEANLEVQSNVFPENIILTRLVRDWYSKLYSNNGILLRGYGDGDYTKGLFTGDEAHASSKEGASPPKLIVYFQTTPPTPSPSASSRPSATPSPGSNGSSTTGTATPQPTDTVEQKIKSCLPEVNKITVFRHETSLGFEFQSIEAVISELYIYPSTRVPDGAEKKLAVDYGKEVTPIAESTPTRQHKLETKDLESGKTYFITPVIGGVQDCEISVATLRSLLSDPSGSIISRISKGLPPASQLPVGSPANLQLLQQALAISDYLLTGNKPISLLSYLGLATLLLSFLTLGSLVVPGMIRYAATLLNLQSLQTRWSIKKKTRGTWGKVISSLSLMGVPNAVISLYETRTGKMIDQTASDDRGIYGFLAEPGTYTIKAHHGGYVFPPVLMPYGYQGGKFKVESLSGIVQMDIPMDPVELSNEKLQSLEANLYSLELIRLPLVGIGGIISLISLFLDKTLLPGIVFLALSALGYLEYRRRFESRNSLVLKDKKGKPLAFTQIRIKKKDGSVVLRRMTNSVGQTYLILPEGDYMIEIITLPISSRDEIVQVTEPIHFTAGLRMNTIVLER